MTCIFNISKIQHFPINVQHPHFTRGIEWTTLRTQSYQLKIHGLKSKVILIIDRLLQERNKEVNSHMSLRLMCYDLTNLFKHLTFSKLQGRAKRCMHVWHSCKGSLKHRVTQDSLVYMHPLKLLQRTNYNVCQRRSLPTVSN